MHGRAGAHSRPASCPPAPPQVTSLVVAPFLLDHPAVTSLYPKDVIERARKLNKVRQLRARLIVATMQRLL